MYLVAHFLAVCAVLALPSLHRQDATQHLVTENKFQSSLCFRALLHPSLG